MSAKKRIRSFLQSSLVSYFGRFLLVVLIVVTATGCALYYSISEKTLSIVKAANTSTMALFSNRQELLLQEVYGALNSIYGDRALLNVNEYYDRRVISQLQRSKFALESIVVSNPGIQSIAVFYPRSNLVLSTAFGYQQADAHPSSALIEAALSGGDFAAFRTVTGQNNVPADLFTFVKTLPYGRKKTPEQVIVIDARADTLLSSIEDFLAGSDSSVIIFDHTGGMVYCSNEVYLDYMDEIGEDIAASIEEPVIVERPLGGEHVLVTQTQSRTFDWRFYCITPLRTLKGDVKYLGRWALAVCLGVIAVGIVLSIASASQMVRPLERINRIVHYEDDAEEGHLNLRTVTDSIAELVDRHKSVEEMLREHRITQRSLFLRDLSVGNLPDEVSGEQLCRHYAVDIDRDGNFVALVISMNRYYDFRKKYGAKEQSLQHIFQMEEVAFRAGSETKAYCVEMKSNEMLLVCQIPPAVGTDDPIIWAYRMANDILREIGTGMRFTFSIGVSAVHSGVRSIPQCYHEAYGALQYRMVMGEEEDHIVMYDILSRSGGKEFVYPFQKERVLIALLRNGDMREFLRSLREFYDVIDAEDAEDDLARGFYLHLFSSSLQYVFEIAPGVRESSQLTESCYIRLYRAENGAEMQDVLTKFYCSVEDYISRKKNMRNHQMIEDVKRYILHKLSGDVTAEGIAEAHFISASYLRKIFKDEVGCTIKDYVFGAKMDKALELLYQNKSIAYISQQVGYATVQAFTTAFTQAKGLSPAKYRKCIGEGEPSGGGANDAQ